MKFLIQESVTQMHWQYHLVVYSTMIVKMIYTFNWPIKSMHYCNHGVFLIHIVVIILMMTIMIIIIIIAMMRISTMVRMRISVGIAKIINCK